MIITLLRKPLEGSVADNALKHGCGALNIDAIRISTNDNLNGGAYSGELTLEHDRVSYGKYKGRSEGEYEQPTGRWPANFILNHLEGCELKGTKKVKSGTAYQDNKTKSNYVYGGGGSFSPVNMKGKAGYADEDGKEAVADWACVEGCPVKELDQQSGNRKTTWVSTSHKNNRQGDFLGALGHPKDQGYNDEGGASRFFKQFKGS